MSRGHQEKNEVLTGMTFLFSSSLFQNKVVLVLYVSVLNVGQDNLVLFLNPEPCFLFFLEYDKEDNILLYDVFHMNIK